MKRIFQARALTADPSVVAALAALLVAVAPAGRGAETGGPVGHVILDAKSASRLLVAPKAPDYPTVAKLNYIRGKVRLRVVVSSEGVVDDARVVEGHPLLAAAALRAAWQWRYHPYRDGGKASAFSTTVNVNFNLLTKSPELGEKQAVRDFDRQVQPPRLFEPNSLTTGTPMVRVRMLVDEHGHVLDVKPPPGYESLAARSKWIDWKFRPARWGSIPIPWYLELDVPVDPSSAP